MDKPKKNIMIFNWSDFDPELVTDIWELLKEARSLIVEAENPIILEFNNIEGRMLTGEEITDWVAEMLEKHPKYPLAPMRIEECKIACYIINKDPHKFYKQRNK